MGNDVVLLLPGMSLNATIFPDLGVPSVRPTLSVVDLGKSGITKRLRRKRIEVFAELLDAVTKESELWTNANRRIVIGHSFGGMLALHWLLTRKRTVSLDISGLVLMSTTSGPMYHQAQLLVKVSHRHEVRIGLRWFIPIWNTRIVTKSMKRLVSGRMLEVENVDFQREKISSDASLDLAGWRNTDWRAMRAFRAAMEGFDVSRQLSELAIPTRVVHGLKDSLLAPTNARYLADHLPNAKLTLVEGAGHALPVTHPGTIVNAVESLLGY